MTTIATNGISIASDGQVTANSIISSLKQQKVFKMPNGHAIGLAGCLATCNLFREWYADQTKDKPELEEDFEAIVIDGTTSVAIYNGNRSPVYLPAPIATGTGREVALGAMLVGATPKEAVKAACKVDIYSSGTIREVTLKGGAQ